MGGCDDGVDAAAHKKISEDFHKPGLDCAHQIVQDLVGHRLVEGSFIAEGPEIEFQGFEFHTQFIRDVSDLDGRKVRLACFGAQTGEFRAVEPDLVIPVRLGVGESL